MTNTWTDIGTSDVIFVIGGNPAENHPMAFKHIQRALDNYWGDTGPPGSDGAKLMVVDPRFTRTAAKASASPYDASSTGKRKLYNKMRSGTDIPFVNGMIKYVMDNQAYNEPYVLNYSNAGFLINEGFEKPRDTGGTSAAGFFSDFVPASPMPSLTGLGDVGKYTKGTWGYCKWSDVVPSAVGWVAGQTVTALGGFIITGTNTQWRTWVRAGDTIDVQGVGQAEIASVDSDTQITTQTVAAAFAGANYRMYIDDGTGPNTANNRAFMACNIATDFWDSSGNCICGDPACGVTKDNLSLDPSAIGNRYIANFRTHLKTKGLNEAFPALDTDPAQRTAWEHMLEHYQDYDRTTVLGITGAGGAVFDDMCQLYATTGLPGKVGTILYAMGTTQHTVGTQNIRAYSTLQILLGNMGLSGGGVNAQRGESNVQGSTDHCLLHHILPGYLGQPDATKAGDAVYDQTNLGISPDPGHPNQLDSYIKRGTPYKGHQGELNWWGYWAGQSNRKRYMASLLKCYYHNHPDWGINEQNIYDLVPKLPGNCSHMTIFEEMYEAKIKMLFCFGQNPAVAGPNAFKERKAMKRLKTLVVSELWETETAAFWRFNQFGQPRTPAEMANIRTEVFLLPAACHMEKDGSVTNSSRWCQWRYKAVDPPGNCMHETQMINKIYSATVKAYNYDSSKGGMEYLTMGTLADSAGGKWYPDSDPPADELDKEINGWYTQNILPGMHPRGVLANQGDLVSSFLELTDDGLTASANWLYTNMYTPGQHLMPYTSVYGVPGTNKSLKRDNTPIPAGSGAPIYYDWAWDWPVNRRIIYNGASLVPNGYGGVSSTPWDSTHYVISWSGGVGPWIGDKNDAVAAPGSTRSPFIMKPEGVCRPHGHGRAEGPYPTHYEPLDTPFRGKGNPIPAYGNQVINPAIHIYEDDSTGMIADPLDYPIVATTYRFSEHWQAGAATRHLPYLCELVPDVAVEMSKAFAANLSVANGDKVKITSPRGFMKARALVTNRFETFNIAGIGEVDHIGIFWHWGYTGIATGHSANRLTPHVGCANTRIPEYKAFLCKVEKL